MESSIDFIPQAINKLYNLFIAPKQQHIMAKIMPINDFDNDNIDIEAQWHNMPIDIIIHFDIESQQTALIKRDIEAQIDIIIYKD
jgi:hypothetical protein